MSAPPLLFDSRRRQARLGRARRRFAGADFLHVRAAEDAVENLSAIMREFGEVVDLSVHSGVFARALAGSPAQARLGPVREAGAQAFAPDEALPLTPQGADLIVSLLSLHWMNDLPGAMAQIRRGLRPDGLFLGALIGGASLKELRWALTEAEIEARGGAQPRVSPFADGFDGGALLQRAGFALPVSDVDRITVTYTDMFALIGDLRAMGETAAFTDTGRPLTRGIAARAAELYAQRYGEADGRIPATFEIINLAGWAPHASQQTPLPRGSAKVRLADALGVAERTGEEPD